MNKETMDKIGLSKYLKDGVIDTPDSCTKICIDVGLSETAPNSAVWMLNDGTRCVIGVEPLEYNWEMLNGFHDESKDFCVGWPATRPNSNGVYLENKKSVDITNKFYGLKCAIDNIAFPEEKVFYHMEAEGASSLLKPSDKHDSKITKLEKVQCVNLSSILDCVDWGKFKVIEHLKVDCEGHDIEVIKSAEKHLDKIIFITYEMSQHNNGHWEHHYDFDSSVHYMQHKGFSIVRYDGGNIVWFNNRFSQSIKRCGWKRHNGNTVIPMVFDENTNNFYYCDVLED